MHPSVIATTIRARQERWLRERYGVTPEEVLDAPLCVRAEMKVEWSRYWRSECEAGGGLGEPTRAAYVVKSAFGPKAK
jgi:hypothetical protein